MSTSAAALYRWVDADGIVHYSDTPRPGAQVITLQKTNVTRSLRPTDRPVENVEQNDGEEQPFAGYSKAVINSPTAEETLWNTGGNINVSLSLEPDLQKGHRVMVYLDGRPVAQEPQTRTSFLIQNVFRGTHAVRATVYSQTGKVLHTTPTITFYVKQNTVNRGG